MQPALQRIVEQIRLQNKGDDLEWEDLLLVNGAEALGDVDVGDDLKRELRFYELALEGTKAAHAQ